MPSTCKRSPRTESSNSNRQLRMCLAQGNICRAFEHVLFGARLRRAPARLERAPASPRALSVPAR